MGLHSFSVIDYALFIGTLLFSFLIGIHFTLSNKTTDDLFAGGRHMKIFPIAASIMVSRVSAITTIGFPSEIYVFGAQGFHVVLVELISFPLTCLIFVPFFYNLRIISVYEYLEYRFESRSVRWFASFAFILQQILSAAIVLYAPSIAMETFFGLPSWVSILGIGVCGTIYTSFGGLKAVVWTDTFQLVLLFIGTGAILYNSFSLAGGVPAAITIAKENGRLDFFDFSVDPFERHNLLNFVIGIGFACMMNAGTRQHEVQRYSSLPTLWAARMSVLVSVPIMIGTVFLSFATGVALFAAYNGCDFVGTGILTKFDELVPYYISNELAAIPGMLGLFTSCMFSGVLSSYSSCLNGIVAVTWEDFFGKIKFFSELTDRWRTWTSAGIGLIYGCIIVVIASNGGNLGSVYQAAFVLAGAPTGVLAGVMLLALFFPYVKKRGVFAGMITGLVVTMYIALRSTEFAKPIPLPTSAENCSFILGNETLRSISRIPELVPPEVEWPEKIFTLSYLLYCPFAALITIIGAIVFTPIAQIISGAEVEVKNRYLHPVVRVDKARPSTTTERDLRFIRHYQPKIKYNN